MDTTSNHRPAGREKNRCSSAYGSIEETIIVYRRGENGRENQIRESRKREELPFTMSFVEENLYPPQGNLERAKYDGRDHL